MTVLYQRRAHTEALASEYRDAAGSPPLLQPMLGVAMQRRQLLAEHINWDRVWFIARDGEPAGYLQGYMHGRGPHRLDALDLRRAFGWSGAAWRRPLLRVLDARFARFEAYLYRLIIRPELRGQGLGQALLGGWLEALTQAGVNRVHLEVWGHNPAAMRFYQRLGFQCQRERRLPVRIAGLPHQRWWLMSRSLASDVR